MNAERLRICCIRESVRTVTSAATAYASRERATVSCTLATAGSIRPSSSAPAPIREESRQGFPASAARDRRIAAIRLGVEAGFAPSRMPSIRPWTTFTYRSLTAKTNEAMFHLFRFVRSVATGRGNSAFRLCSGRLMETAEPRTH